MEFKVYKSMPILRRKFPLLMGLIGIVIGIIDINQPGKAQFGKGIRNYDQRYFKKEIDLDALSKKYPRCKNTSFKDNCYGLDRHSDGVTLWEGYWINNALWDGVYTNRTNRIVVVQYIDGKQIGADCSEPDLFGWSKCPDGSKQKSLDGDNDMSNGRMIVKWRNGNVYEGNFKNNKKHGYGVFKFSNGDVYEGNWINGLEHGYGVYTWSDGDVYEGNWSNGQMVD